MRAGHLEALTERTTPGIEGEDRKILHRFIRSILPKDSSGTRLRKRQGSDYLILCCASSRRRATGRISLPEPVLVLRRCGVSRRLCKVHVSGPASTVTSRSGLLCIPDISGT